MLYQSVNELGHFAFHDATILRMELTGQDMVWVAKDVNVTTANPHNPYPTDRCLDEATIAWVGFAIRSIVIRESSAYNYDGTLIEHVDPKRIPPDEQLSFLRHTIDEYCWIHGVSITETPADGKHGFAAIITLCGEIDIFDMELAFEKAVVSWDTFNGKAWYVDRPPTELPDA